MGLHAMLTRNPGREVRHMDSLRSVFVRTAVKISFKVSGTVLMGVYLEMEISSVAKTL
jgi:hypothetical protein